MVTMIIKRKWEMPNSRTFKIKCIKELIISYTKGKKVVVDPFANEGSIKRYIDGEYISNDLDNQYKCDYNMEAQDFMKQIDDESVDVVLYDPPYSGRQVSECYKRIGKTVNMEDTNSGYWNKFKNQIKRIVKPNGIVISFGWNSNGIGKKNGFEIIEILMVAHGSGHYDTIVTIEKKINQRLSNFTQAPSKDGGA